MLLNCHLATFLYSELNFANGNSVTFVCDHVFFKKGVRKCDMC